MRVCSQPTGARALQTETPHPTARLLCRILLRETTPTEERFWDTQSTRSPRHAEFCLQVRKAGVEPERTNSTENSVTWVSCFALWPGHTWGHGCGDSSGSVLTIYQREVAGGTAPTGPHVRAALRNIFICAKKTHSFYEVRVACFLLYPSTIQYQIHSLTCIPPITHASPRALLKHQQSTRQSFLNSPQAHSWAHRPPPPFTFLLLTYSPSDTLCVSLVHVCLTFFPRESNHVDGRHWFSPGTPGMLPSERGCLRSTS